MKESTTSPRSLRVLLAITTAHDTQTYTLTHPAHDHWRLARPGLLSLDIFETHTVARQPAPPHLVCQCDDHQRVGHCDHSQALTALGLSVSRTTQIEIADLLFRVKDSRTHQQHLQQTCLRLQEENKYVEELDSQLADLRELYKQTQSKHAAQLKEYDTRYQASKRQALEDAEHIADLEERLQTKTEECEEEAHAVDELERTVSRLQTELAAKPVRPKRVYRGKKGDHPVTIIVEE